MPKRPAKPARREPKPDSPLGDRKPAELRIIGGSLRGRKLFYSGRFETRPMKDRVREAIFNLVGPSVQNKHAIDLFAGTGALGLEAISRGAASATLIEQHIPTAQVIQENATRLCIAERVEVASANTFAWVRMATSLPTIPWLVFCSPPYDFYIERTDDMLLLLDRLWTKAPAGSILVVEADQRFDFNLLPLASRWDVRSYPPAVVGLLRGSLTAALSS